MEKYHKKWKKLAKHQSKFIYTTGADVINAAQILSDAYDLDKLDCIDVKECILCQEVAKKRCSKCKEAWYCGRYTKFSFTSLWNTIHTLTKRLLIYYRECQVKDWEKHKAICDKITKNADYEQKQI